MGELAAALVSLALLCALVGGVAAFAGRSRARRARRAALSARSAVWEVADEGTLDATRIFLRKVTVDGVELERSQVALIPDGAADWHGRVLEARAAAAERAALLNAKTG